MGILKEKGFRIHDHLLGKLQTKKTKHQNTLSLVTDTATNSATTLLLYQNTSHPIEIVIRNFCMK